MKTITLYSSFLLVLTSFQIHANNLTAIDFQDNAVICTQSAKTITYDLNDFDQDFIFDAVSAHEVSNTQACELAKRLSIK